MTCSLALAVRGGFSLLKQDAIPRRTPRILAHAVFEITTTKAFDEGNSSTTTDLRGKRLPGSFTGRSSAIRTAKQQAGEYPFMARAIGGERRERSFSGLKFGSLAYQIYSAPLH